MQIRTLFKKKHLNLEKVSILEKYQIMNTKP